MVVAAHFRVTDCPAQANRIADRKGPTYDERDKSTDTKNFSREITQAAAMVVAVSAFLHTQKKTPEEEP